MEMLRRLWGSRARGAPGSRTSRWRRPGGVRRRSSSGQAMVEFALIAPLFFMLIFGVVEYSLINASIGTFNFAAKDAARLGAIIGNGAVQITSTSTMPVDQYMVNNVIVPRVTGIVFAQITEVDIFDAAEDGSCVVNGSGTCKADVWTLSKGTWTNTDNWPASTRNDALSNADYLGVKILYTYTYLTAFFAITSPTINLTAESIQRIEPQQFGDRFNPGGAHTWAAVSPGWSPFTAMSAPFTTGTIWTRDNQDYLMTTGGRA